MTALLILLGILVLVLMEGFFSGSEIALVHCDKVKLRARAREGHAGSKLALRLFEKPEVILSTTLVGTNIALVVTSVLATTLMIRLVGASGDALAVVLLTPLVLIAGEVVPKSVFQQKADELTPRIIYPLYAFTLLLYPVVFVFSRVARLAAQLAGRAAPAAGMFAVREQLRAVLDTAEGAASIDVFDRTRIRNVMRFGEFTVGDVMTPAAEMTAVDIRSETREALGLVRRSGHTRLPVYDGQRNNVTGLLSLAAWDLVAPDLPSRPVHELMQPAHFVPAQQTLAELLPVLRGRDDQTAIVVDEYGSAIGMITVGRILATVIGPTGSDEIGGPPPGIDQRDADVYEFSARLPVTEINDALGLTIEHTEAHTLGGLMTARLRHVPLAGESITEGPYRFTVLDADARAVLRIRAERRG